MSLMSEAKKQEKERANQINYPLKRTGISMAQSKNVFGHQSKKNNNKIIIIYVGNNIKLFILFS